MTVSPQNTVVLIMGTPKMVPTFLGNPHIHIYIYMYVCMYVCMYDLTPIYSVIPDEAPVVKVP